MSRPDYPFEGYDQHEDLDYRQMQSFIVKVESWQAIALAEWMLSQFPDLDRIVDLGCGPGIYLIHYKLNNRVVFGVDACSQGGVLLQPHEFQRVDLRFPQPHLTGYDLAYCFEVAEHLEAEDADQLVDTICAAPPLVLFTGAVPGQGGTFHKNEQPHSYWIEKFAARGFRVHEKQEALRAFLATMTPQRQAYAVSGWLLDNCYLLAKA